MQAAHLDVSSRDKILHSIVGPDQIRFVEGHRKLTKRQSKCAAHRYGVGAIVRLCGLGERLIVDIRGPPQSWVDPVGRRSMLSGHQKGIGVDGSGQIVGPVAAVIGVEKRKLGQREDRSSSPLAAKPACISARAPTGSSSKRRYKLRFTSSRAEKELGFSAEIALAVSDW